MKTVDVVYNTKKKKGETQYGKLFNDGKVRKRREWRGLKDTLYDFSRWLYLWSIVIDVTMSKGAIKGLFRYRWMSNYLAVPHAIDKFTMGQRDETLRITHTAMDFVVKDVAKCIKETLRGDRRCGNDVEFSNKCVLSDENAMTVFMMGFPQLKAILREIPCMFSANIMTQQSTMHYLDVAQRFGIPGDVCPMPEAEAGISIEDDFSVLGKCAVQVNTTCDGSLMGNGLIAKRLEREYGIPTFQLAAPMRHESPDVLDYAANDMKACIAWVEEQMGVKWDWDAYFEAIKRVNATTRMRWSWLEVNSTNYPQFYGAVFSLFNDTDYMGNCGRSAEFPPIEKKINDLVLKGYKNKTMQAKEYRHRCIVWGVQPQYCIDQLYWMINCWGVIPLTDMLSMVVDKQFCEENKPENYEQAYKDMAYLNMNMIMRNKTHGGYQVLVDELWEHVEKMNADMVMMWEHMSCKALNGLHGQFEDQARERGIHIVWVNHDLCDPRVFTRQQIRDEFSTYMRTVLREEPLDPTLEFLPDEKAW